MHEWHHDVAKQLAGSRLSRVGQMRWRSVGGGSINRAYECVLDGRRYFVKCNEASRLGMFEAEAEGLRELGSKGPLRVPSVHALGHNGIHAWIVLEWIEKGTANEAVSARFGEQLACLHGVTASAFGWGRDNTIGSTPQPNAWMSSWHEFWAKRRLGFQIELCRKNGLEAIYEKGQDLLELLPLIFSGHEPAPSLLHGDLWGGNWFCDRRGQPVIFDPAVYYGDREADLAMTELFGGFSRTFYQAYAQTWPLDEGYAVRKHVYNLYHILNHANLFGGGYVQQARAMMERLVAECR